jgi:hypothetical protein
MTGKVDIIGTGATTTISLNGDNSTIAAGINGANGVLHLQDAASTSWWGVLINCKNRSFVINKVLTPDQQGAFPVVTFNGTNGRGAIGGNGVDGDFAVYPATIAGASVHHNPLSATIHLDGKKGNIRVDGDIALKNADCAEEFDVAEELEPGTVVALDAEGKIRQSQLPYDKRVAGVISGAGAHRPAILLDKRPSTEPRMPIALVGKVSCKVDAGFAPIEPGDLLTTSSTPGHAMKATDPLKSFGAVLGKALRPLASGCGMLPILVALQ